jgi:hypothetical protein
MASLNLAVGPSPHCQSFTPSTPTFSLASTPKVRLGGSAA